MLQKKPKYHKFIVNEEIHCKSKNNEPLTLPVGYIFIATSKRCYENNLIEHFDLSICRDGNKFVDDVTDFLGLPCRFVSFFEESVRIKK